VRWASVRLNVRASPASARLVPSSRLYSLKTSLPKLSDFDVAEQPHSALKIYIRVTGLALLQDCFLEYAVSIANDYLG